MAALAGRTAWVTGAGTGIGRAIAVALAREGAAIGISGRSPAPLAQTAALIEAEGGRVVTAPCDVSNAEQVANAHAAVVAALGEVDILVNNAGWNLPKRAWKQLTPAAVQQMTAINLNGPFLCTLAVLPAMRSKRDGVLVHIASLSATGIFMVSGGAYTATKYGARAMSATLNAEEGINGIRSICINPGETETPLMDQRPQPPDADARAKMVQPSDVAAAVVFCATLPARTCVTELTILPTDNNLYRAEATAIAARA
jgi:NADP-dependent 3-hydroxy acid dehydrogenase YdfG